MVRKKKRICIFIWNCFSIWWYNDELKKQCDHFRILAGTRPYWWINESDTFSNLTRSTLRQTHLTCETTAGNPSGHVMFTASILLFITRNMHIFFQQTPWIRRHLTPTFNYLFWNIYVGILGLIAISRMYFACHFFHQCVLGIFCGFAISHFLQDRTVNRCLTEMQRINSFLLGICFVILCVSVYYSHYLLSINPQWAVKKVFQVISIHFINNSIEVENTEHMHDHRACNSFNLFSICHNFWDRWLSNMPMMWILEATQHAWVFTFVITIIQFIISYATSPPNHR